MLTGVTVGVLCLLKYGRRVPLETLAKLCNREEGFDDPALVPVARKNLQRVLEKAYKTGKGVIEDEVLDGVMALVGAYAGMCRHGGLRKGARLLPTSA